MSTVAGLRVEAFAWTIVLLLVLPFLMIVQAGKLRRMGPVPRRQMYISSIISLWALAAATLLVARVSGFSLGTLRLAAIPWTSLLVWGAVVIVAGELLVMAGHAAGARGTDTLRELLPVTRTEKLWFVLVSATAGICEELMFRGFLLLTLTVLTHSLPVAALLSATSFGIVHAYQDPAGVLVAGMLALLLTAPVVMTGSLYPSIVAHFAIDIIGGYWLGPRLLRTADAGEA